MRYGIGAFATAAGYFKKTWYKPYLEGFINLIVSIILAPHLGIMGVFLGTTVSLFLGSVWLDPVVTFKYWFKKNPIKYFISYLVQFIVLFIMGFTCYYIVGLINITSNIWIEFIVKGFVCFSLSAIIALLFSFKTKEFKSLLNRILKK